jgi:tetratricopeptide (TPR) repeat protein
MLPEDPGNVMKAALEKSDFNRNQLLRDANDARAKGKRKRAVELYKAILARDPEDFEVHHKLAQILAEAGDLDAAKASFHAAAEGYHKKGFSDRAIALFHQTVEHVPEDVDAWLRIAELYVVRLKKADAQKTLGDARKIFKKKRHMAHAARVLKAAMFLEPNRIDLVIDAAQVEKRRGDKARAVEILDEKIAQANSFDRRVLRKAMFFITPSLGNLFRWMRNAPPPPSPVLAPGPPS